MVQSSQPNPEPFKAGSLEMNLAIMPKVAKLNIAHDVFLVISPLLRTGSSQVMAEKRRASTQHGLATGRDCLQDAAYREPPRSCS